MAHASTMLLMSRLSKASEKASLAFATSSIISLSMRGKWDSVAFGLGVAVLVLDTLLVEHLRHLFGNIFEFLRVRDDVEFFFLLLRIVRLGFLSLRCHGAFSA